MARPGLFGAWGSEWRLRRGAATYVASLGEEPAEEDVQWLARIATGGDLDRARWELRYARRALGLLVAERDALDDRTGSVVARELTEGLRVDRRIAAAMVRVAERQFNDRLAIYRGVLTSRGAAEGTGVRLGQALLRAGGATGSLAAHDVAHAGDLLAGYLSAANEALRKAIGAAALPADQAPSTLQRGSKS